MALLAPQVYSAAAHADTVSSVSADDTCWLGAADCGPSYAPPPLLGPDAYAAMTPAQAASMRALERQAVTETLELHDLPATDRDAVSTWARPSAQAALFVLVTDALRTPLGERTEDQQHAAEWMAGLVRSRAEADAQGAGAEYARWAGLDVSRYRRMVDHRASQEELTSFLARTPETYSDADRAKATGGYCTYQPPAPFESEYQGRTVQSCYTHCSTIVCLAPTPSYDSFVRWGQAAASYSTLASGAYQLSSAEIATEVTFIVTRSVVMVSTVIGTISALLLEFPLMAASILPGTMFAYLGYGMVNGSTVFIADLLPSVVSTLISTYSIAAMISTVTQILAAISTAVLIGIKVYDDDALPAKLASLVIGARTESDPAALLDTEAGATTLYSLFVQATLPMARADLRCGNDDPQVAAVCLNATPVPVAEPTDPVFLVHDHDAKPGEPAERVARAITLPGPADHPRTVRVAGTWFVQSLALGSGAVEAQTLGLGYTDWTDGQARVVWLVRDDQGDYGFVGVAPSAGKAFDPATCEADGSCWKARSLHYLGADGHRYEAHVEPYRAPTGQPTFSAHPTEGSPVAFDAHGFAPAGAVGPLRYGWQFQRAGCGQPCTTPTGPSYGEYTAGATPVYAWQTSGSYQVRLEVRDSEGRTAVTTMTVPVAGVPPVVATEPGSTEGTAGVPVNLTGKVEYAGTLDNEDVTVHWGDGSTDVGTFGPNRVGLAGGHLQIERARAKTAALTATHVFSAPGTYEVTVSATNQAGQGDSLRLSYTIAAAP